jgi:hypothetical protein
MYEKLSEYFTKNVKKIKFVFVLCVSLIDNTPEIFMCYPIDSCLIETWEIMWKKYDY